jgi:creatinine amidohydrolase/Fe(II)-dependent formamide hydrolase-like protein
MSRLALAVLLVWTMVPDNSALAGSVYIEDLTWPEVRDAIAAGKTSAIIYAGSTEQNGPHLALGKHNFVAHYVAGRIAEELGDALVYPTLPFAPAGARLARTGHMRFPGSVSVDPEIFLGIVRQVAESAAVAGFKNVFVMGDHGGGQAELKLAAEELDDEWAAKGVRVYYVPDLYFKEKEQMRQFLSERQIPYDAHAGTDDTSEVMYIDPERKWVRFDKLAPSDAKQEPTTGVDGDPSKATPELGKLFIGFKVSNAVSQIRGLLGKSQ